MPKFMRLKKIIAKIKGKINCHKILKILPIVTPTTGTNNNAIKSEEVSTHIRVIGKYFINSPARPGQNTRGANAARVVRVDAIIGNAILFDADLKESLTEKP